MLIAFKTLRVLFMRIFIVNQLRLINTKFVENIIIFRVILFKNQNKLLTVFSKCFRIFFIFSTIRNCINFFYFFSITKSFFYRLNTFVFENIFFEKFMHNVNKKIVCCHIYHFDVIIS